MKVRDPQGQTWRVTRRWVPWRPRRREVDLDATWLELTDGLVVGLVVLVAVVTSPIWLPVVLLPAEALLVLLVLPAAVLGRVLLGRRWTVEARRGFRPVHEELTGTWNDASVRIAALAHEIERGQLPVPAASDGAATGVAR